MFSFRKKPRRMLVLGLDCAAPELLFEQYNADLPTLRKLMASGTWGELNSCIPCITVPAWSSMLSSRDPGTLGVYGFRNRADRGYGKFATADNTAIQHKRVWDYLSDAGKRSIVVGVPQTYPLKPLNGEMIGCFLTPGLESAFAYPALLKQEVLQQTPQYQFDVRQFRTHDKAALHQSLLDMTEVQIKLIEHLLTHHEWDFFMHVNIGLDRIHHGFWRYMDANHRLHEPGSPFEHVIRDYYRLIDQYVGKLIEQAGDNTQVLIVSDHGAKRMDGGICINEWLWRNGWLSLKTPPESGKIISFESADVDWARTRAWASGGYYARIFLNVAGREPQGIIFPDQLDDAKAELAAALIAIADPDGNPLKTQVFFPETIYQQVHGVAPDLMVYFGDLHWRAVGGLGYETCYTLENDTGPDDANHAQNGLFILYDPQSRGRGKVTGHQLMDIAPTLLHRMGLSGAAEMQGQIIR